ncbi:MAG: TIGR03862 family flavoprotein [Flavobacteriales bacterium]|nr:TIGR03862 family flavoprotein [Flavobacteriales bacterium]
MSHRPTVSIIGGGPAGLIAADLLAGHCTVHVYERGRQVGRKFLVAGDGGLNITHSDAGERLFARYLPAERMRPYLHAFGPEALRAWLEGMGIPTFVGTSGRVFPQRGIKPYAVLAAMRERLRMKGVHVHLQHHFVGFNAHARPVLEHAGGKVVVTEGLVLFALGGASWPVTGSTGDWVAPFRSIGVQVTDLAPSNCGVEIDLPDALAVHEGKPLKNIRITCGTIAVHGEATLTRTGLEGNAIYPVISAVREALREHGQAVLEIDLKPDVTEEELQRRLSGAAWKERMAALRLDRAQVALFKAFTPMQRFVDGSTLAHDVKHLQVPVHALRPIGEAISSAGGITWDELRDDLALVKHPHLYAAGEMIDWDAPTGGFLLQGAFALGHAAAMGMLKVLGGA